MSPVHEILRRKFHEILTLPGEGFKNRLSQQDHEGHKGENFNSGKYSRPGLAKALKSLTHMGNDRECPCGWLNSVWWEVARHEW